MAFNKNPDSYLLRNRDFYYLLKNIAYRFTKAVS